jgi:hypothetical protein
MVSVPGVRQDHQRAQFPAEVVALMTVMRVRCWYCRVTRWRWVMLTGKSDGTWWCRNEVRCLRRYGRTIHDNGLRTRRRVQREAARGLEFAEDTEPALVTGRRA